MGVFLLYPQYYIVTSKSSPRTWGCFHVNMIFYMKKYVFPTHVGVFLTPSTVVDAFQCLPHARGGVSMPPPQSATLWKSSPRTWGCFYDPVIAKRLDLVFPTHVGVFP